MWSAGQTWPGLFWLAWILLTLHKMFYWPAYHAEIIYYSDRLNRGTELSWLFAVTRGVGVLGPMIGGVVATYLGFPVLFVLAAGLALVAGIPLLRTEEHFQIQSFSYSGPWRIIVSRKFRGVMLSMIGWGENLVDLVFWPILMFIVLGSVDLLGYIATLNVLIMTLLGFFIGEASDRFSRQKVLRLHVPFMVLGYLLRPLALSPLRVLLTDTLSKAAFVGVRIPQWYRLYAKGRQVGPLRYAVALETTLAITKAVISFALVGVFVALTPYVGFTVAFILAAALSLLYVFL